MSEILICIFEFVLSMSLSQTDGLKAGLADDVYTTMEVIICTFLKMLLLHPKTIAATYLMLRKKELHFIHF